ncbi:MAG: GNAT family N-acetyltransferase [Gammaproteobacteria bacterium]|nr:GNAT family N-acetyltransferase [Gammaproteobacteria bacterium]
MKDFLISTVRPDHWEQLCDESGAFFSGGAWLDLLASSFKCRTLYVTNDTEGFSVSVFRGGPFHIGYLGFPVGGGVGKGSAAQTLVEIIGAANNRHMPICIRIPVSAFGQSPQLDHPFESNPETAIEDLQAWSLARVSKNLRRDIRKAQRSGLDVSLANSSVNGKELYDIYAQTVKQHGGAIRYNAEYFHELLGLARGNSRLRVLLAKQGNKVAGFAVTARHGDTTCYLHGGASLEHRKLSPSDLLLHRAICDAQHDGSQGFNLMASPEDQPSLVRYKEKWGGTTRNLRTYTIVLRPSYQLFRLAEKIYRMIR